MGVAMTANLASTSMGPTPALLKYLSRTNQRTLLSRIYPLRHLRRRWTFLRFRHCSSQSRDQRLNSVRRVGSASTVGGANMFCPSSDPIVVVRVRLLALLNSRVQRLADGVLGVQHYKKASLRQAFQEFENSNTYWRHPPSVRMRFQQVVSWWPVRDAQFSLADVNASFAKRQRDRMALAQGWRAGNFALVLLQALVARAVDAGALPTNRVKVVPKILPPRHSSNQRRGVQPIRHRISASLDSSDREKSSG